MVPNNEASGLLLLRMMDESSFPLVAEFSLALVVPFIGVLGFLSFICSCLAVKILDAFLVVSCIADVDGCIVF